MNTGAARALVLAALALSTYLLALPVAAAEKTGPFAPGITLPEGDNRALVVRHCTTCHDLKGVPAFKGYWNRQQWLAMVETMRKHGAGMSQNDAGKIADYLSEHFGRP